MVDLLRWLCDGVSVRHLREGEGMTRRRGVFGRLASLAVAGFVSGGLSVFVGPAAAAAPGATFYLAATKKTVVSFVIPANGNEVSRLGYRAAKLRCSNGKVARKGMVSFGRTVPVQESPTGEPFFEAFWAAGAPRFGGIAGTIGTGQVKGELDVRITQRRKVTCESGTRSWTAEPVSEEAWLAARERAGIPEG